MGASMGHCMKSTGLALPAYRLAIDAPSDLGRWPGRNWLVGADVQLRLRLTRGLGPLLILAVHTICHW